MIKLWIAEKPDLAKVIARAIGENFINKDGYLESTNNIVTWCYGHILEMKRPEEFNPCYKQWSLETLPLKLYPISLKPKEQAKKQVNTILSLIKKADTIVHLGDPDDEGQLLVDEVLIYANNKKPVERVLINDMSDNAVKKAISESRPNSEFKGLYKKALARLVADTIYGLSLTRACTVLAKNKGTLSIGRVQTPTLGLITKRYLDYNEHKESFFYELNSEFNGIKAIYKKKDDAPIDEKKRIIEKSYLEEISRKIINKIGVVIDVKKESKESSPPLPYNLIKLQQDMSNKFNYTASQTLEITQSLREKHKAITYNRSDCSFLSSEQHEESPQIIKNLKGSLSLQLEFDHKIKSKAFNDSKITAHTAIIPTQTIINMGQLTEKEQNVYSAICCRYLVQFLPNKKYDVLTVTLNCENEFFNLRSSIITDKGFTVFFNDEDSDKDTELNSNFDDLKKLSISDKLQCVNAVVDTMKTKPLPLFTESSLLASLVRIADFVTDPYIKKLLKSKDKDKQDEHGGIGTPATRHQIIENLKTRKFIETKGKNLIPTNTGIEFYKKLPEQLFKPDLTALMFEKQEQILSGALSLDEFVENLYSEIESLIKKIKSCNISEIQGSDNSVKCPFCEKKIISNDKVIKCSDSTYCGMIIWRKISGKEITEKQVTDLLTKGKTALIKGFKSSAGKEFNARLVLVNEKNKNVKFDFDKK